MDTTESLDRDCRRLERKLARRRQEISKSGRPRSQTLQGVEGAVNDRGEIDFLSEHWGTPSVGRID